MWSLEGSLNLKNENYVDSLSLIWAGQGSAPLPSCYYLHPGVFVHRAQPGAICLLPHPEVCGVEQGRPEWVPTATLGLSSPALLSSSLLSIILLSCITHTGGSKQPCCVLNCGRTTWQGTAGQPLKPDSNLQPVTSKSQGSANNLSKLKSGYFSDGPPDENAAQSAC